MLFDELDRIASRIKAVDPQADAAAFANQMFKHRANALRRWQDKETSDVQKVVILAIASGCIIKLIQPLPAIIDELTAVVRDQSSPPYVRCAVVGALGYLVQPRDLIPDGAPGGYGFIDDSVILHATLSEYRRARAPSSHAAKDAEEAMTVAASMCPPTAIEPLKTAVQGATIGFQLFPTLPPNILEDATQKIIADPFQAAMPGAGSQAADPGTASSSLEKRNLLGMTFEASGDTIAATFPDGEAVIVSG